MEKLEKQLEEFEQNTKEIEARATTTMLTAALILGINNVGLAIATCLSNNLGYIETAKNYIKYLFQ